MDKDDEIAEADCDVREAMKNLTLPRARTNRRAPSATSSSKWRTASGDSSNSWRSTPTRRDGRCGASIPWAREAWSGRYPRQKCSPK